jgi:hypothetical protein
VSDTLAFAQYLTLRTATETGGYRFQNYWVNEDAPFFNVVTGAPSYFGFMPFAFSGTTFTKTGDNQPAKLSFPNNALSRGWAETAVTDKWLANTRTVLINPDDKTSYTPINVYIGQIVSAKWDDTALVLELASVLDATGAAVPRKRLTKQLVGSLPLTANVRIQ